MTLTNKSTDKKSAGQVCENEGHHLSWPLRHIEFIDKLKQIQFHMGGTGLRTGFKCNNYLLEHSQKVEDLSISIKRTKSIASSLLKDRTVNRIVIIKH